MLRIYKLCGAFFKRSGPKFSHLGLKLEDFSGNGEVSLKFILLFKELIY